MDMLKHLHDLAFAASMAERGKILMEGRWLDTSAATQLLQRRREERADFARVTAEAERATNYPTAFQLLDNVLIRHPDSTYTADVQRVIAMLHAEAADKKITDKAVRGAEQIAAANNNPQREMGSLSRLCWSPAAAAPTSPCSSPASPSRFCRKTRSAGRSANRN